MKSTNENLENENDKLKFRVKDLADRLNVLMSGIADLETDFLKTEEEKLKYKKALLDIQVEHQKISQDLGGKHTEVTLVNLI